MTTIHSFIGCCGARTLHGFEYENEEDADYFWESSKAIRRNIIKSKAIEVFNLLKLLKGIGFTIAILNEFQNNIYEEMMIFLGFENKGKQEGCEGLDLYLYVLPMKEDFFKRFPNDKVLEKELIPWSEKLMSKWSG